MFPERLITIPSSGLKTFGNCFSRQTSSNPSTGMIIFKQSFSSKAFNQRWPLFLFLRPLCFRKHLCASLTCLCRKWLSFSLDETLAQDVVARHQHSCFRARLAGLQVYRSKSSRQPRVWQTVLQILALTQKLQGRGAFVGGQGSCITGSMPWTHLHLCLGSQHQNRGQRGSRQSKQVLVLPAFGS